MMQAQDTGNRDGVCCPGRGRAPSRAGSNLVSDMIK